MEHWRKCFHTHGLAGLYGEQRPGRPHSAAIYRVQSHAIPIGMAAGTAAALAARSGISLRKLSSGLLRKTQGQRRPRLITPPTTQAGTTRLHKKAPDPLRH